VILSIEKPQTYALGRMTTGTGFQSFNTIVPSAQDENLTTLGHRNH